MKRLGLLVVLVALSMLVSACNTSPPAATVNGVDIPESTLNQDLTLALHNDTVQCALAVQTGQSESPAGVGTTGDGASNAVTTSFAATELENLILEELERQVLAAHRVQLTDADVRAATADYKAQLAEESAQSGSPCNLTGTTLTDALPAAFVRQRASALAAQERVEEVAGHIDVSPVALASYYRANRSQYEDACINLIVADTHAAAQIIYDTVTGGTSFAQAAQSAEADTENTPTGGAEPCVAPAVITESFGASLASSVLALRPGQIAPPLALTPSTSTRTYWLVVQMRQRQLVPLTEVESAIRLLLLSRGVSRLDRVLTAAVRRADITVDPRYGQWHALHGVTVPVAPPVRFVPNAAANLPASSSASSLPGLSRPTG